MIKFQQKEYVGPLVALLPAAIEGATSLINNKRNNELEEQQMMMESRLRRKELELQNERRKFAEKLAKNDPAAASQIFQGQGTFSVSSKIGKALDAVDQLSEPALRLSTSFNRFAEPITTLMALRSNRKDRDVAMKRIEEDSKIRMQALKNDRDRFMEVQKLIRENPQAAALIYQGQGTFSVADTAKEVGKSIADVFGKDVFKRSIMWPALVGLGTYGAGKYISHLMKENNVRYDRRGRLEDRYFSKFGERIGNYFKGIKNNAKDFITDVKTNPKDTLLDSAGGIFTSYPGINPAGGFTRSGMVNREKIKSLADKLSNSSDANAAKIGQWIEKNPRYSTLMAVLAGYGLLKGTSKLTKEAIERSTRAFDPEAYEYFDAMKNRNSQRLFTKYDYTDNLKRMTDADILAERKHITHTTSKSLNAGLGGSVIGALLASILSGSKHGFDMKLMAKAAKRGAYLGGAIGLLKGINDTKQEREDADWFNRRLEYAKYQARRREAKDWRENIGGRDRYTY